MKPVLILVFAAGMALLAVGCTEATYQTAMPLTATMPPTATITVVTPPSSPPPESRAIAASGS